MFLSVLMETHYWTMTGYSLCAPLSRSKITHRDIYTLDTEVLEYDEVYQVVDLQEKGTALILGIDLDVTRN